MSIQCLTTVSEFRSDGLCVPVLFVVASDKSVRGRGAFVLVVSHSTPRAAIAAGGEGEGDARILWILLTFQLAPPNSFLLVDM
jgi:hypothetical protein